MKKVLIVVDVANTYFALQRKFERECKLDYSKLLANIIRDDETIFRAIAYLSQQAKDFESMLQATGFETKYREPLAGRRRANWNVEITTDIAQALKHVDVIVICSADGELVPCVEFINGSGKQCRIVGAFISSALKNCATSYREIPIDWLKDDEATQRVDVSSRMLDLPTKEIH